jgi:hypothetical protein
MGFHLIAAIEQNQTTMSWSWIFSTKEVRPGLVVQLDSTRLHRILGISRSAARRANTQY